MGVSRCFSSHRHVFIDQVEDVALVSADLAGVISALDELPDPRAKCGVMHGFVHLLVIRVCSVVADVRMALEVAERASDTARSELQVHGIRAPHSTTLARVFKRFRQQPGTVAFVLCANGW